MAAEQRVYWREQGRNALNFQQAGFKGAAQEYDQTAGDEVHVAVAQDRQRTSLKRKCLEEWALLKIAQSDPRLLVKLCHWAKRTLSQETHSEIKEEIFSAKQMLDFNDINGRVMDSFKNISRTFNAIFQKFEMKFKLSKLRGEKKLKNLEHEVSQSLVEGAHHQTLHKMSVRKFIRD